MEVRGAAAAGGVAHCGAASDTRTGRAGCGLGYPRSAKPFLVATAGWTIAALLMLIFVGDGMDNPGCGVGEVLQGACERQLAAANSERFANATLPLLLTIAAGYLVIAFVALVVARRRRRSADRAGLPRAFAVSVCAEGCVAEK